MAICDKTFAEPVTELGSILNKTLELNCQFPVPLDCVAQLVEAILQYDTYKIDVSNSLWAYLKNSKLFFNRVR